MLQVLCHSFMPAYHSTQLRSSCGLPMAYGSVKAEQLATATDSINALLRLQRARMTCISLFLQVQLRSQGLTCSQMCLDLCMDCHDVVQLASLLVTNKPQSHCSLFAWIFDQADRASACKVPWTQLTFRGLLGGFILQAEACVSCAPVRSCQ